MPRFLRPEDGAAFAIDRDDSTQWVAALVALLEQRVAGSAESAAELRDWLSRLLERMAESTPADGENSDELAERLAALIGDPADPATPASEQISEVAETLSMLLEQLREGRVNSDAPKPDASESLAALLDRVEELAASATANYPTLVAELPSAVGSYFWGGGHLGAGRVDLSGGSSEFQLSCACLTCRTTEKSELAETALVSGETSATDEGTGSVAPGGTAAGIINTSGDVDHFTINLVAGQTYTISLRGAGGDALSDSYLQLLNASGVVVARDDDGGSGTNSLLTFTAITSGTYQIAAAAYPGSGLTGGYTVDVRQMGSDSVAATFGSAKAVTLGQTTFGFVEASRDVDMYKVTLTAGTLYNFDLAGGADYNTDPNNVPKGELDTRITIYDANGNQVAFNDDHSFPDDVSSGLGFTPTTSGTYYIKVDAYRYQTGGYTLDVNEVDLASLDPLDSIDWGTQLPSNNVTVYFAAAGETFDGVTSLGWSQYEIEQAMEALQTWAEVSNLTFTITNSPTNATFKLVTTESTQFLGYFIPPGEVNAGVGVFAVNGTGWNTTGGLEQGGFGWVTLVHEFGHGLGLAHPHDNGGSSEIMPGVTAPFDSFGVYDLNQGVYTTMSYNDGWQLNPSGTSNSLNYGYQGGPGAFDIALIQVKYGASSANTGDNVYVLPTANIAGTFWDVIWDTGGTDTIAHTGTVSARIDLTAATLDYSATGAGVISYVNGIYGGFTIAAGVVIENAIGGSGADVLIGNSAANVLTGNAGNDTLQGNAGTDTFKFKIGDGQDTVTDLTSGEIVEIRGYTAAQSVTASGSNVVVVLSSTDQITFQNTDVATVQAALLFPDATGTINGTSVNDTLIGTSGPDTINGLAGADKLYGLDGNDRLDGGDGNDTLDGGAGQDLLIGGTGNDSYYVDSLDTVVEAAGEGFDTVWVQTDFVLSAGAHVEQIGTADYRLTDPLRLTGNEFNNTIIGNNGNNTLQGMAGDDRLRGLDGADVLDGGAGNDTLEGGAGNDVFRFAAGGGSDTVTDLVAGEAVEIRGYPSARSVTQSGTSVVVILSDSDRITFHNTTVATVEAALLFLDNPGGTEPGATINGTSGNDTLIGTNGPDTINGLAGADKLNGLDGDDRLDGGDGNDTLDGGAGQDVLIGGTGNDTYYVDSFDTVVEAAGEGFESVWAHSDYVLSAGAHVEQLGTADYRLTDPLRLTGNEFNNTIIGNNGNNTLRGMAGDDTLRGLDGNDKLAGGEGRDQLTGGAGADDFIFDTALNASTNVDKILDFSSADDTILLDRSVFAGIAQGTLSATAFHIGAAAVDADDRIIYDQASGKLYYDPDGSGGMAAVQFAQLNAGTTLTSDDLFGI